jgi:RNA polymerase sigma-70 factor (ECF subfamily)
MNSVNPLGHAMLLSVDAAWLCVTANMKQLSRNLGRRSVTNYRFRPTAGYKEESSIDNMDDLLIAVAKSRNRDAYRALFEHFAPRVKSFLLGKGGSPEVAEEAVQEAMLNVWRRAATFNPTKASASTWIFTIARNARIDLLRKTIRPTIDPNDPALVPDPPMAAFEAVSAGQDAERIRKEIMALPAEQQEVLRLAFFEDLAHAEVAKRLDIPLGTVKSRIRLAIGRIRSQIGEHE